MRQTKKYIYTFSWVDENGSICGWNDTYADNIKEARSNARKQQTEAHWALYENGKYVTVDKEIFGQGHCFRMKGTYAKMDSFRKTSVEAHFENHRLADMMCR